MHLIWGWGKYREFAWVAVGGRSRWAASARSQPGWTALAARPMMLRAVPLMLLASTWAQEPYPSIATTKTTSQGGSTVCLLERSYTPEISVPVGGKVHVRLYGELPRTQENYTYIHVCIRIQASATHCNQRGMCAASTVARDTWSFATSAFLQYSTRLFLQISTYMCRWVLSQSTGECSTDPTCIGNQVHILMYHMRFDNTEVS